MEIAIGCVGGGGEGEGGARAPDVETMPTFRKRRNTEGKSLHSCFHRQIYILISNSLTTYTE